MDIQADRVASIHYHLTSDEGEVIDSSRGREPLVYLHGHGTLVPGVEKALSGKVAGDHIETVVSPADGYGEHDEELDGAFPIEAFPDDIRPRLRPGVQFAAENPKGDGVVRFTIIAIEEDKVLATGNHPLSGKTLHFEINVVEVREATEVEKTHGHIHQPGCSGCSGEHC